MRTNESSLNAPYVYVIPVPGYQTDGRTARRMELLLGENTRLMDEKSKRARSLHS